MAVKSSELVSKLLSPAEEAARAQVMAGKGELPRMMREFDWAATPLGPVSIWPQSLRTAVSLILNSQHPMWIGWGYPEITFLYNDAYIDVLSRAKHPWALGRPFQEVWAEIWDVCGPLAEKVFKKGEPTFVNDVRLFMNRGDILEETYYSFSYSPIYDEEGNVGGLFCPSAEVSAKVLNARRLRTLSEFSSAAFVEKTVVTACTTAIRTLAKNPDDVPFSLLYVLSAEGKQMRLQGSTGLGDDTGKVALPVVSTDLEKGKATQWPISAVAHSGLPQVVSVARLKGLPLGPADQPLKQALVLPVKSRDESIAVGVLIAGINPTRRLDDEYRTFYDLIAGHVATAIGNARAYEEERKRSEALAELDRAKTKFFSNVSHEFRTPLTLMLGPVEDALGEADGTQKDRLELVHRNALRLLKLVNTLLDFSRIEAGRMQASFRRTDLTKLTGELVSVFGSTIEQAGLRLVLNIGKLGEDVFVDREMWEKIVLNLVSNAFKSTFEGSIEVSLQREGEHAVLEVKDTGTGIADSEIPHLFERFRRVEGALRRTHEGSGIGLALVNELVQMHGGSVDVQSVVGKGSKFRVTIPLGSSHLSRESIKENQTLGSSASFRTRSYVQEAAGWIDADTDLLIPTPGMQAPSPTSKPSATRPRVLLVDDNRDMRGYVERLLSGRFEVATAENGKVALSMARKNPPDLILSDVMMPEMDGFELLSQVRKDPKTSSVPLILLSARAGEESKVEGMEAGADDYLVKPFTAKELIARVDAHVKIAQFRRTALLQQQELEKEVQFAKRQLAEAIDSISDSFVTFDPQWRYTSLNKAADSRLAGAGVTGSLGKVVWEIMPALKGTLIESQLKQCMQDRVPVQFEAFSPVTGMWLNFRAYPTPDGGIATYATDVTERRIAENALRLKHEQLVLTQAVAGIGSWQLNLGTEELVISEEFAVIAGLPKYVSRLRYSDFLNSLFFSSDRANARAAVDRALRSKKEFAVDLRLRTSEGVRLVSQRGKVFYNQGDPIVLGVLIDMSESARETTLSAPSKTRHGQKSSKAKTSKRSRRSA